MTKITLLFGVLSSALFCTALQGQTINAASCNASDVQTALKSVAADGTTVVIPAGNCTWQTTVTYNQVYTTTIQGQTTCTGTPASSCTDNTTINANTGTNAFWVLNTASGKSLRLTGLTFTGGDPNLSYGAIVISGGSQKLRIDHCHFNNVQQTALNIDGVYGVIDHVVAHVASEFMRPLNSSWNGVGSWGDNSFAQPTGFGTDQFIFLEDSTMTMTTPSSSGNGTNDCYRGGKFVVRHNILNYSSVQGHGTGHAGEDRGCRAAELYDNTFTLSNDTGNYWQFNGFFLAGGPAMIWGNTLPTSGGNYYTHFVTAHINREDNATYGQSATPNGWGYCGTAVSGTGSAWDQNSASSTGYACLDQVGRGQGDLLSTGFPNRVNTSTGSIAWPRQKLEPVYEWGDTWGCTGDSNCSFWVNYDPGIVQNRDYFVGYNNSSCPANPSGNCTAGVGVGTLANRPASCTTNSVSYPAGNSPGVGYWATDMNTLYVCSATNTWTAYYTPYTYPHPLTQGSAPGPDPPPAPAAPSGPQSVLH
jgi:hypothetical protein